MKYILTFLLLVSYLFSAKLEENSVIQFTEFKNQYDKPLKITKNTKKIILANTNEEGKKIKEVMLSKKIPPKKNEVVFLADLSLVPDFLMNLFMEEKFKDFKHEIGLIEDGNVSDYFPQQTNKITVITIDKLKVKKIEFVDNI